MEKIGLFMKTLPKNTTNHSSTYLIISVINKLKLFSKFVVLILLSCYFQLAKAQVYFNSIPIKKKVNDILIASPSIDSIHIQFFQNTPSKLEIFNGSNAVKKYKNGKDIYFYDLFFDGDKLLLSDDFPTIKKLLNENLATAIQKPETVKNFKLVIGKNHTQLRDSVPIYGLYPTMTPQRKKDFQNFLNSQYKEMPKEVFRNDSVLLFQAVVDKGGNLIQIELLKGRKGDFYSFILDKYSYYVKNILKKTNTSTGKSLLLPAMLNGRPIRSLIDIYVRLNPNNTISISSNGIQRRLRIKNYQEKEGEPLIWW